MVETLAAVSGKTAGPDHQVILRSGKHRFLADEPEQLHGGDTAPDPYSLLLAALISCTAITLKMYAARKGWPLDNAEVECRLLTSGSSALPEIERIIFLHGALSVEQKQRLLQIASACPVHKLLSSGISIHSCLKNSD